jgi:hypothetical protein
MMRSLEMMAGSSYHPDSRIGMLCVYQNPKPRLQAFSTSGRQGDGETISVPKTAFPAYSRCRSSVEFMAQV